MKGEDLMFFIKVFVLMLIFLSSLKAGKIISKKYSNRVMELKEMKNALNMFLTKIKFTYESIPESFRQISENINGSIGKIFKDAAEGMKENSAGDAWDNSVEKIETSLTKEDKDIIKGLRKNAWKNRFRWTSE